MIENLDIYYLFIFGLVIFNLIILYFILTTWKELRFEENINATASFKNTILVSKNVLNLIPNKTKVEEAKKIKIKKKKRKRNKSKSNLAFFENIKEENRIKEKKKPREIKVKNETKQIDVETPISNTIINNKKSNIENDMLNNIFDKILENKNTSIDSNLEIEKNEDFDIKFDIPTPNSSEENIIDFSMNEISDDTIQNLKKIIQSNKYNSHKRVDNDYEEELFESDEVINFDEKLFKQKIIEKENKNEEYIGTDEDINFEFDDLKEMEELINRFKNKE